ncbi:GNAT family N-acetyltransferase [Bradyrhizobium sp.]|uniref:GNAT family N-acetyltransferase n=1 Tax=Bradyrhizobium sp. TaxID=376 RepID=UPI00273441A1|nr:GNAT family N-acetyltransferase [Bradyrhizobium sp.]MDP3689452.1 GNAT family N-acetyltransferase [Bradyrhizobium sp.]
MAALAVEGSMPQVRTAGPDFRIELIHDWEEAAAKLEGAMAQGRATPFQNPHWLGAWYHCFASNEAARPLIVVISDARSRDVVAILPLVVRMQRGLRIAEFAGSADYNAPILGPAANGSPAETAAWWRHLCRELARLPGGCDLVRFRKMPAAMDGQANPLAGLPGVQPSALTGHLVRVGDDYDAYRYSLEKTVRKELERSWRVFTKHDGAGFRQVREIDEALRTFAALEVQQSARMHDLGRSYSLDEENSTAFHRELIVRGLVNGYVILTALTCGEETVASLLGIRTGLHYVMVRIGNAGKAWSNCSPGRLVIERTMAMLHADGVRTFDFSVGSYDYKRRFGVSDVALIDLTAAVSWRGWPVIIRDRLRRSIRRA